MYQPPWKEELLALILEYRKPPISKRFWRPAVRTAMALYLQDNADAIAALSQPGYLSKETKLMVLGQLIALYDSHKPRPAHLFQPWTNTTKATWPEVSNPEVDLPGVRETELRGDARSFFFETLEELDVGSFELRYDASMAQIVLKVSPSSIDRIKDVLSTVPVAAGFAKPLDMLKLQPTMFHSAPDQCSGKSGAVPNDMVIQEKPTTTVGEAERLLYVTAEPTPRTMPQYIPRLVDCEWGPVNPSPVAAGTLALEAARQPAVDVIDPETA